MKTALIAFLFACAWAIPPAQAIRPGQPSSTAEWVCFYRGVAAQHPDPRLRNPDDLAEKLCQWPANFPDNYAGARLAEHFGAVPDYVRYAPIDFDKQKLADVLPPLGYDPKQRTLFILEGVSMYVIESGNGATLDFIGKTSAPGSRVVYDYALRDVVEGRYEPYYAAERIATTVRQRGEPFVTGWTPDEAAAFAARHGLVMVEDVGDKELVERYMTGSDGKPDGRLLDWQRIIEAKVP